MIQQREIDEAAWAFDVDGDLRGATRYGSGHINDSYCAVFDQGSARKRFLLQRINTGVFADPRSLMENIERVTAHLAGRLKGEPDDERRVLRLVPTRTGLASYLDVSGNHWRMYRFVERTRSYDAVESVQQAFEVAKAVGRFQYLLSDLPLPRLHDTIPDFHHTPKRFAALRRAIEADSANRAASARAEIEFALAREPITPGLLDAALPERVTHNDTKLNNVLFDDETGEGICVIDLDTVMPGLAPYDFGDMVRTSTSPAQEDERDLSKVTMQFDMFEALVRGYFISAGEFLTKAERGALVLAGKLITFEIGIRFLTDFLSGDPYFRVHREGHNLDRCRTQFKLVSSIEQQEERMRRLVESM